MLPSNSDHTARDLFLQLVKRQPFSLASVPAELRADKEVVLAAVAAQGRLLKSAHVKLKADKEVVLTAVAQSGYALEYASADLRGDKDVVLAAVAQIGHVPAYVSSALFNGGLKAYVMYLLKAFSFPVPVFVATILRGSMDPSHTDCTTANGDPRRRRITQTCILKKINAAGPDGARTIKELIAAFAGVPCRTLCPVPWTSVSKVMTILSRKNKQGW